MIFGNAAHFERYDFLGAKIAKCFEYANKYDLLSYEKGSYPIDGKDIFVNIVEYDTKEPEERFWEAHRQYSDIHFMLRGPEQIDVNFIDNLEQGEFKPEEDFLPLEGPANCHVQLKDKGDFLICYPEDGHMTALKVDGKSATIKKAIFKVIL